MNRRTCSIIAAALLAFAAAPSFAQAPAPAAAETSSQVHLGVGVVRALDPKARTITLSHQAIRSMGMPAMTMAYPLADGVAAGDLKTGATVAFVLAPGAQGSVIASLQPVAAAGSASAAGESHSMMGDMPMMSMMDHCRDMMGRK